MQDSISNLYKTKLNEAAARELLTRIKTSDAVLTWKLENFHLKRVRRGSNIFDEKVVTSRSTRQAGFDGCLDELDEIPPDDPNFKRKPGVDYSVIEIEFAVDYADKY